MPARHSWISYACGGQKPRVRALIEPIRDARWEKSLKAAGRTPMGKKTVFPDRCLCKNDIATIEAFAINRMTVWSSTGKFDKLWCSFEVWRLLRSTNIGTLGKCEQNGLGKMSWLFILLGLVGKDTLHKVLNMCVSTQLQSIQTNMFCWTN